MSTASGNPEHMYRYSDRNTQAAQSLHSYVMGVLGPVLSHYLNGSIDQSSGVNIDTSAVWSCASSVWNDLPNQLASAYDTDRDVRKVGLAFQIAGGQGQLDKPVDRPLVATDAKIQKLVGQYNSGGALKDKLTFVFPSPYDDAVPVDEWDNRAFMVLRNNANNPEFCQGVLQAGGDPVAAPKVLTSLLTALASGQFDANLLNPPDGSPVTTTNATELLSRILANGFADPNTAAILGPALPAIVKYVLDQTSANTYTNTSDWANVLPAITAILSQLHDPTLALRVTIVVGQAIPNSFSADDLRSMMPQLTALMSMGVVHGVPPIGNQELGIWAQKYGSQVGHAIEPFLAKMRAADLSQNAQNDLLKTIFQGTFLNVVMFPLGLAPGGDTLAAAAGLGALQSWLGANDPTNDFGLGTILKDTNPALDVVNMNNLIDVEAGHFAIIATLLEHGYIRDSSKKGDVPLKLTGGQADVDLIKRISADPFHYHLTGGEGSTQIQQELGSLLNDFNSLGGYINPNSMIYPLITQKE